MRRGVGPWGGERGLSEEGRNACSGANPQLSAPPVGINVQDADGDTPLHEASKAGSWRVVKLLLAQGANPNMPNFASWTPLVYAAKSGHLQVARALLEHGASADIVNENGETALIWAVHGGHIHVADCLLSSGSPVNVNAVSSSGVTALSCAYGLTQGKEVMVHKLIAAGADPAMHAALAAAPQPPTTATDNQNSVGKFLATATTA